MISEQTKAKYEELAERVRSRRAINWKDVAKRLKSIRQKVEGNGSNCCNQQAWKRIVFPEEAETSRSSISKLENGDQIPSADILARYAAAGGVSLEWLLYGEEEKKEEKPTTLRNFAKVISNMMSPLDISIEISPSDKEVKEGRNTQYCIIKFPYRRRVISPISGNDDLATVFNGGPVAAALLQLFKFHQLCDHLEREKISAADITPIGYSEKILSGFYTFVQNGEEAILETIPDIHDETATPLPAGLHYVVDPYGNQTITNMTQEEYISQLKAARKHAAAIADNFK